MRPSDWKTLKNTLGSLFEVIRQRYESVTNEWIAKRTTENEERKEARREIGIAIDHLAQEQKQSSVTNESNQDRRHRQNLYPQWITAISTTLAFGAAAIYAGFAYQTWQEVRRQANAAQSTLGEIQKQTTLLKQQIVGTMGAALPAESPRPAPFSSELKILKSQNLYVYFANVGRVPSPLLTIEGTMTKKRIPGFSPIGTPEHQTASYKNIRPFEQLPPGVPGLTPDNPYLRFQTANFTQDDIQALEDGHEVVEVTGHAEYGDGFANTISQDFCFMFFSPPRGTFSWGPQTNVIEGEWGFCKDMKDWISHTGDEAKR